MRTVFAIAFAAFAAAQTALAASPAATQAWTANYVAGAAASKGASPAATRAWVKNYVATNAAARAVIDLSPISAAATNDIGHAETLTLTFTPATCRALRVENSNVGGMTNGTLFAKSGADAWANFGNGACTGFSGAAETNGAYVIVCDVRGETFVSSETAPGLHSCTSAVVAARRFDLRACMISEREYTSLLAPRPALSLLSLLFRTASAVTLGDKEVVSVEEVSDGVRDGLHYRYRQRYFTDASDIETIEIGLIAFDTANGNRVEYNLGVPLYEIAAGVPVESFAGATVDVAALEAAVEAAIGRNRSRQFWQSQQVQDRINALIDEVEARLAKLAAMEPVESEETVWLDCKHRAFSGKCGNWTCTRCHAVFVEVDEDHPAEHYFHKEDAEHCSKCQYCGEPDPDEFRHVGWYNAQIGYPNPIGFCCRCLCGHMNLPHVYGETVAYVADDEHPLVCWHVWTCARCGQRVDPAHGEFIEGITWTPTAHDDSTDGKFEAVTVDETNDVCRLTYTCHHIDAGGNDLGCGSARSEDFAHLVDDRLERITGQGDTTNHWVGAPCVNGLFDTSGGVSEWKENNPSWCGYTVSTNKPHIVGSFPCDWDDPDYPATRDGHVTLKFCGRLHEGPEGYYVDSDGTNTCGKLWTEMEAHDFIAMERRYYNRSLHVVTNCCGECGGRFEGDPPREAHADAGVKAYGYIDNAVHAVSNYCGGVEACYSWYAATNEAHVASGVDVCVWESRFFHVVSNQCQSCAAFYYNGLGDHDPDEGSFPSSCESDGAWTHTENAYCRLCRTPDGGLAEFPRRYFQPCTNSTYAADWVLVDDPFGSDVAKCQFCTNTHDVAHGWQYVNEAQHRCANGGGHLWDAHEFTLNDDGTEWRCVCGLRHVVGEDGDRCACCRCTPGVCDAWSWSPRGCGCAVCVAYRADPLIVGTLGDCFCCAARDIVEALLFAGPHEGPVSGSDNNR